MLFRSPQEDTIILRKGAPLTNAVFLHEAVHAATVTAIRNPNSLKGDRRKGFDQLNELYTYASKHILNSPLFTDEDRKAYGLTKLEEFTSEVMTNPEFQALLRTIRYKASGVSVYSRFMHAVRMMLGLNPKEGESNVFAEALEALDTLMPLMETKKTVSDTGYFTFKTKAERVNEQANTALEKREQQEVRTARAKQRQDAVSDQHTKQGNLPLGAAPKKFPVGRANTKTALNNLMTSKSWDSVKANWPAFYASLKADVRPSMLGRSEEHTSELQSH